MIYTLALGNPFYGIMASNLALSLKHLGQPCNLITDEEMLVSLKERVSLFDKIVIMPKDEYTIDGRAYWGLAKLKMHKYLPNYHNLFIDADSLVGFNVDVPKMLDSFKGVTFTASYATNSWGPLKAGPQWYPKNLVLPDTLNGSHDLPLALSSAMMFYIRGLSQGFHECAVEAHEFLRMAQGHRNWRWFGSIPDELCLAIAYSNYEMPNVGDQGYLKVCSHNKDITTMALMEQKVLTFSTGNFDLSIKPKGWYDGRVRFLCKEYGFPFLPYKDKSKLHARQSKK